MRLLRERRLLDVVLGLARRPECILFGAVAIAIDAAVAHLSSFDRVEPLAEACFNGLASAVVSAFLSRHVLVDPVGGALPRIRDRQSSATSWSRSALDWSASNTILGSPITLAF